MAGSKDQETNAASQNGEPGSPFDGSIPSLGPHILHGSMPSLNSYANSNGSSTQSPQKLLEVSPTLSEMLRLLQEDPTQQTNVDKILEKGNNLQPLSYPNPDEAFQSTKPYPLIQENISSQAHPLIKQNTSPQLDLTNSLKQDLVQPQTVPNPDSTQKQSQRAQPSTKSKRRNGRQSLPPRQGYRPILPKGYKPPEQPQVEPKVPQLQQPSQQPSQQPYQQPDQAQTNQQQPYRQPQPFQAQPLQAQPLQTQSFQPRSIHTQPFQMQPHQWQPHEQPDFLQQPVYGYTEQLVGGAFTSRVLPPPTTETDPWPEDLALDDLPFTSTVLPPPICEDDTWPEDIAFDDHSIHVDPPAEEPVVQSRITTRTRAKQLASRASRHTDYYPEDYYTPLQSAPSSWDFFRYTRYGELKSGDTFSAAQILYYLANHPNHTSASRKLILWIQRLPADSKSRYPNAQYSSRCRFEACPGESNLINQGHYRVTFDELSYSHPNHDPMHNAGYVHLYCLERFLDFPSLCKFLDIRVETRNFPNEPRGKNGMIFRNPEEVLLAQNFIHTCRHGVIPDGYPHCSLPSRPHEGTLTHRLTLKKLDSETKHQRQQREDRGGGDSVVSGHLGDLEKEAKARNVTRKFKNQNRREFPAKTGPKPGSKNRVKRKQDGDGDTEDERPRKRRPANTRTTRRPSTIIEAELSDLDSAQFESLEREPNPTGTKRPRRSARRAG